MDRAKQKQNIKHFVENWSDSSKYDEKQNSQSFWIALARDVFGVERPEEIIDFERRVKLSHTSYMDAYVKPTKVLVEQKSAAKDLRAPIPQSDGTSLTPFQQAKRYATELPRSLYPRYVVTCNFKSFLVYDMETPDGTPQEIHLKDLEKEWPRLQFMFDVEKSTIQKELEVSFKAGKLVGEIYDAFMEEFKAVRGGELSAADLHSLNVLCVRLVFCLYAEDFGIFNKDQFYNFMKSFKVENMRMALKDLFKILDTKECDRDPFIEKKFKDFPYVNGNLFKEQPGEVIPSFSQKTADVLLDKASVGFDWSDISPTIFGAVFESTLNPETRRKGGMHYTSIENIHKVIDPLFLDSFKDELVEIKKENNDKKRNGELLEYRKKLGDIKFLDPACGSGNFLTETYISLRKLENEALDSQYKGQAVLDVMGDEIYVNIHQFYGIEINDFAATVAKTALWIAESQMMEKTAQILHRNLEFLPLKSYSNIAVGNALQIDWASLQTEKSLDEGGGGVPLALASSRNPESDSLPFLRHPELDSGSILEESAATPTAGPQTPAPQRPAFDYIIGNPPFVGARLMSAEQKQDLLTIFGKDWKNIGNLDYVCGWYKKCADMIDERTRCALVSTNSVSQGEMVADLWKPLFESGIQIDFAHRTFRWDSESNQKAHVHCVIIGFSSKSGCNETDPICHEEITSKCHDESSPNCHSERSEESSRKRIFNSDGCVTEAKNINAYLLDGENVFVESRSKPLCDVPEIGIGNKPIDDGNYLFKKEEMEDFIKKEPASKDYFKPWYGSEEFIHRSPRYCLWLGDCSPAELHQMPKCLERVENVRNFRLSSKSEGTRKLADKPTRFHVENMPKDNYIILPKVSSEKRRYVPMGYMTPDIFCSDLVFLVPSATLFHFGILTSSVHMGWMRAVCGRLKTDYRYSKDVVYNNFPWPNPTESQKQKIEATAQAILDARNAGNNANCSLADFYDETTMPIELRNAHRENDRAVMAAYGFDPKMSESEIVAELLKKYQALAQ